MDTIVEVTIVGRGDARGPLKISASQRRGWLFSSWKRTQGDTVSVQSAWQAIDTFLADFEERYSVSHPKSEVLALNSGRGSRRQVSAMLAEMIDYTLRYGDSTNGMFDCTILPVKELWGFGETYQDTFHRVPPADSLTAALVGVDYRKLSVELATSTIVYSDSTQRIDVGGVAKGYALRELARLLIRRGYGDFLISAGGDVLCQGTRIDGKPWNLGIQHPRHTDAVLAIFPLDSGTVVTSGDYERFWIKEGKRYSHLFDPRTGQSCTGNQSVTIWAMDPIVADIFSTGFYCLPAQEIVAAVERRGMMECLVVDSTGAIFVSGGWKERVRLQGP